jgi:hypothetical protein
MAGHRRGGRGGGIVALRPASLIGLARQGGGVGVEAEADLTAALLDERRQPIREDPFQAISRP